MGLALTLLKGSQCMLVAWTRISRKVEKSTTFRQSRIQIYKVWHKHTIIKTNLHAEKYGFPVSVPWDIHFHGLATQPPLSSIKIFTHTHSLNQNHPLRHTSSVLSYQLHLEANIIMSFQLSSLGGIHDPTSFNYSSTRGNPRILRSYYLLTWGIHDPQGSV